MSQWNGNVFISGGSSGGSRIIFVGEAGNTKNQTIHAIKICLALNGNFELITDREVKGDCSAVIINAGIIHTIRCNGSKIFLIYLLPETQEAREIRWEFLNNDKDNRRAGVYDIPKELIKESLPFLPQMLQDYSTWDCKKVFRECDNVIQGLGKMRCRQLSTSFELAEKLDEAVKKTINYIYTEVQAGIINQDFNLSRFETSVICNEIKLPPNKAEWLENEFRKETGTTIGHFFRDIQMLAALKFYAFCETSRKAEMKKLGAMLNQEDLDEEVEQQIWQKLEELEKKTPLTKIAESLGYGGLDGFSERIRSRLGISLRDIRGKSDFFSCD